MANLAVNKHAKSDYEFLDKIEGGLALTGAEVKSAKLGNVKLQGAFLTVEKNELWLKNAHIGRYKPAGVQEEYDPTRSRKVLVHRKELNKVREKKQSQGLTLVPIRVYTKGALVKLEFAIARGKKKYEKRESIKKRDVERRMKEEMKKSRFAS